MHTAFGHDGVHPAEFRRVSKEKVEKYGDGIECVDGGAVRVGRVSLGV